MMLVALESNGTQKCTGLVVCPMQGPCQCQLSARINLDHSVLNRTTFVDNFRSIFVMKADLNHVHPVTRELVLECYQQSSFTELSSRSFSFTVVFVSINSKGASGFSSRVTVLGTLRMRHQSWMCPIEAMTGFEISWVVVTFRHSQRECSREVLRRHHESTLHHAVADDPRH